MATALVLGSGGTRGGAWEVGTLLGLRDHTPELLDAELVIGTSAGALLGALLTLGVTLDAIARHQHGSRGPEDPDLPMDYDAVAAAASLQPRHPFRPGEPQLLMGAVTGRAPVRLLPALAALLPRGGADPARVIGATVRAAMPTPQAWPEQLRIVVLDAATGRRRVLGPADRVPLDTAVAASCAVPGIFAPPHVRGHDWYDGGFASADSADVAASLPDGRRPSTVTVLSPVTVMGSGWPPGLPSWLEQRARASLNRRLRKEVAVLRGYGIAVDVLRPDAAGLELMGHDLMAAGPLGPIVDLARDSVDSQRPRTFAGALSVRVHAQSVRRAAHLGLAS